MVHKKCATPLRQQYFCPTDNEVVERDAIVKGYEHTKGQFVLFTNEELKAIEEEATKAIAIEEFIPLERIDPVYFDKPYYVAPDKGASRPYRLLATAMSKKRLGGLARYAARGKQYLVLLRPHENGLVMQQLRYADEVRPFSEIPIEEKGEIKDAELGLALQLIDQTTSDTFQPERYTDEVKGRLEEIIQQKIEGEEIAFAPGESPRAQVIDLMEALKASLGVAAGSAKAKRGAARSEAASHSQERKPAKASPRATAKKAAAPRARKRVTG
jgi:DNA end-binding protein Ku